ncbi:MAG: carboxylating nicotinate-nucleotide diphosphorylase [Wolinella sp.]
MRDEIMSFVVAALREDVGRGDLFALMDMKLEAHAVVVAKSSGIFSGQVYAKELCALAGIEAKYLRKDGEKFEESSVLLELCGDFSTIVRIERVLLNMLEHSSGIATHTRSFVDILPKGSKLKILDTRKTRPLLRSFEKYSVRNGGGSNHRFGLDDCLMLKDTHLRHIDDLSAFIATARTRIPWTCRIEVECESVHQMIEACEAGADIIMCDNMNLHDLEECAKYRARHAAGVLLEASGNITQENLALYVELGFDALSSGSLIHQARWLDMSLKMQ